MWNCVSGSLQLNNMASARRQQQQRTSDAPPVQIVQLEGLVALKIIKHCEEESDDGIDLVQGVLLGLVVEQRLEITNCFPIPRASADDDFDNLNYQMEMMRNLRHVNVDHLHVGWYQSTFYGSFLNKTLLDSQFTYQSQIEESVALIYDPTKTAKDQLSLRAFRLSKAMMEMRKKEDFSAETIIANGLSFETMFEEIPVVIKNSHLMNVTLCEIEGKLSSKKTFNNLDMATGNVMENYLRLLMDTVEDLSQDTNRYQNYQKQYSKQQQSKDAQLAKRHLEDQQRIERGEKPLGNDDIHKMFKPLPPAQRLEGLLLSSQVQTYSDELLQFATQSFGKLFMADALQPSSSSSAI